MTKILLLRFIIFLTAFTCTLVGTKSISLSLALGKNLFVALASEHDNLTNLSLNPENKIDHCISSSINTNQASFSFDISSVVYIPLGLPSTKVIDKRIIFPNENNLPVLMLEGKFRPPSV